MAMGMGIGMGLGLRLGQAWEWGWSLGWFGLHTKKKKLFNMISDTDQKLMGIFKPLIFFENFLLRHRVLLEGMVL